MLRDLDATELASQVLVGGLSGPEVPPSVVADLGARRLGGVILFKRNLGTASEVAALVRSIARAAPPDLPPLIAVDQEGGRVARLGAPVLALPPMRRLGELGDPDLTRRAARLLGRQLAALGFSCDFAPVLDVDTNPDNPVIGDRAFGRDPETVITHALAFSDGLTDAGVLSCGKHFPGHGDTDLDSHLALPTLAHDRRRLDAVELAPFRAARGRIPTLMTAHVVFESLDPGIPATLSRRVVHDLLRVELGYDGLVISDDLEMKAVSDRWGVAEAAIRAIEAGCDTLLVCSRADWLAEARAALAQRARRDDAFAARLRDAAERAVGWRRRRPPRPATDAALHAALHDEEAPALEQEISERCP